MNATTAAMHAQRSANKLLETVWGNRGFPVDPVWIAGKLGVSVIETALPETVLGALIKDQHKDPVIVINQLDEPAHKRFNCAHKIGHYADHLRNQDDFYKHLALRDSHVSTEPTEIFANRFSIELLMPTDEIERLQVQGLSTSLMAQYFGVPEDVMENRIADMRLCA